MLTRRQTLLASAMFAGVALPATAQQRRPAPAKPGGRGKKEAPTGSPADTPLGPLSGIIGRMKDAGVRVSMFVDPEEAAVRWAARTGADRIELYTEPFARAYEQGEAAGERAFAGYVSAATTAHALGLGINAGHDLDLENLRLFKTLPHLDEVSIGHALVSHALWVGLDRSVRDYLQALL